MKNLGLGVLMVVVNVSCAGLMGGPVEGPHGIKGVRAGNAYAYVVPVQGGVVVVDAGDDETATALKETVGGQPILAVLITHAHGDHVAGAAALGDVPVHMGRDDIARARGMERHKGPIPGTAGRFQEPPPAPARLLAVDDGQLLSFGGETFTVVGFPGHTPGSMGFVFKDVLFSGDAALGGDNVAASPFVFNDDTEESRRSINRIEDLPITVMLDGHNGMTEDPKGKLDP